MVYITVSPTGHIQTIPWYKALSRHNSTLGRHQPTFNTHLKLGHASTLLCIQFLVVGGRSSVGAGRRSVVTAGDRLVVSVVVKRAVSSCAVRSSDS